MPTILIGADTPSGLAIAEGLISDASELRLFVSDSAAVSNLKTRGAKVAVGDLSDSAHLAAASLQTFCAILVTQAARDGRELAFAKTPDDALEQWAEAMLDAGIHRIIWVDDDPIPQIALRAREVASVAVAGRSLQEMVAEVLRLESSASL